MKLPTISRWTAGDQPDADTFNEMSYALDFAMNPPTAWVTNTGSSPQSIPATTWTPVDLDNIVIDTGADAGDDPVWTIGEPTKLYLQTPGWYDIEANIRWANSTSGNRRLFTFSHNGNFRWRQDVLANGVMQQRVAGPVFINLGEYLELQCWSAASTTLHGSLSQNSQRLGLRARWFSR